VALLPNTLVALLWGWPKAGVDPKEEPKPALQYELYKQDDTRAV